MPATQLTEYQICLVEESFANLAPHGGALVASFYEQLFDAHPEAKPMFDIDVHIQQKKLLGTLALAVENLRQPAELHSALKQATIVAEDYGFPPEDGTLVKRLLLKTIAYHAGDVWGPELEDAWTVAVAELHATALVSANLATA